MNKPVVPLDKMIESIDARFVSGNEIPVERTIIKQWEWDVIKKIINEHIQNKRTKR